MKNFILTFDRAFIRFFAKYADELARVALAIIFFWFGILKLFELSPAEPLVVALMQVTFLADIPAQSFLIFFGAMEAIVGILVLLPRFERITFLLLAFHLCTTAMPLFLLPEITWTVFPIAATLTGQYILKNLALISIGLLLVARLKPMSESHSFWGEESEQFQVQ